MGVPLDVFLKEPISIEQKAHINFSCIYFNIHNTCIYFETSAHKSIYFYQNIKNSFEKQPEHCFVLYNEIDEIQSMYNGKNNEYYFKLCSYVSDSNTIIKISKNESIYLKTELLKRLDNSYKNNSTGVQKVKFINEYGAYSLFDAEENIFK